MKYTYDIFLSLSCKWETSACYDDMTFSILGGTVLTASIKSDSSCRQFLCLVLINAIT